MNQNPANSQNPPNSQNPQQPPQQPKKKVRQTFTLKPEHFQKQNGLQALYKAIDELDLTKTNDNIELSMKKIVVLLRTWHFEMLPRYDFDYFLQRCKALGNNKFTQAYMSKVRRIHKGEDTWSNQVQQQTDALQNVQLDNLNPNAQQKNHLHETLEKKIQNAMKIVNEIENRQFKEQKQNQGRKMQIENTPVNRIQMNEDSEEDDDCEQLLRQMEELQKQKKQLFSKGKEQPKIVETKSNNNVPSEKQEQIPYVPEGFQDIDYGQESSYND